MPEGLLKFLGIIILIFLEGHKSDKTALDLAKRSLLEHEQEYIKKQPMSEDLRSFIERHKRKNQRSKRNLEENFYIIQNGQLVPVKTAKARKANENEYNNADGFTVVPLVIPIQKKTEEKLVKTRTLADSDPIPLFEAQQPIVHRQVEQTTPSNETEDDEKTNKDETQVLHKILEDVEGLMQWKHDGNKKEGVICNLNGSWISDAAGMRFDITYQNSTRKKFRIHVAEATPPKEEGFLCDGNWTVFGDIPFLHSGLLIVLAVHQKDKHLATFIGECRVCEGSESVSGTWLIGRSSRDCKDQKASHKILSDIWRREQGHSLRKKHLEQLGYKPKDED